MKSKIMVLLLFCATSLFGGVVEHIGSYDGWDAITWDPISGLNDPDDGNGAYDFAGDEQDTGAYWADNGTYVFFRMRVKATTFSTSDFDGTHQVFIDVEGTGNTAAPDYAFAWDSANYNNPDVHGLEMQIAGTLKTTWDASTMDDIDGDPSVKDTGDINGNGRTTDGYIRTVDGQSTTAFGNTTFIDFAVSWDYLEKQAEGPALARGQTWNIALGSIANGNDHSKIGTDIAGDTNPDQSINTGWVSLGAVPEPATISLIGISGLLLLISRRFTS